MAPDFDAAGLSGRPENGYKIAREDRTVKL
jgi:hypothetical protein